MNLKTLLNKTIAGAKYILAQPTMMFRNRDAVEIIAYHTVKDDEAVRPDLIALEHYRDDSKTDIILKWNGISDPFSLLPGEVLEIPSDMVPFYKLDRPVRVENNKIKNQFVQGKKMNKKDQNRLDALKKKYNKEVLLPPNVIAIGKKNYRFTAGGTVILGAQAQNDAVTDSIISDLANGQGLRDDVIAQQSGNGSGSGTGSGSGGGTGLTETQLDKNLLNNAGRGGASAGSGAGAGSADPTGGAAGDGTAPQSTGGAANISNDGAPCN